MIWKKKKNHERERKRDHIKKCESINDLDSDFIAVQKLYTHIVCEREREMVLHITIQIYVALTFTSIHVCVYNLWLLCLVWFFRKIGGWAWASSSQKTSCRCQYQQMGRRRWGWCQSKLVSHEFDKCVCVSAHGVCIRKSLYSSISLWLKFGRPVGLLVVRVIVSSVQVLI